MPPLTWSAALSGENIEKKNYLEETSDIAYNETDILDAYGTPYIIKDVSKKGAVVLSAGPNRVHGDEDDITQLRYINALLRRSEDQPIKVRVP